MILDVTEDDLMILIHHDFPSAVVTTEKTKIDYTAFIYLGCSNYWASGRTLFSALAAAYALAMENN